RTKKLHVVVLSTIQVPGSQLPTVGCAVTGIFDCIATKNRPGIVSPSGHASRSLAVGMDLDSPVAQIAIHADDCALSKRRTHKHQEARSQFGHDSDADLD